MITEQDVITAYETLLGRSPENAHVVYQCRAQFESIGVLLSRIAGSEEFVARYIQAVAEGKQILTVNDRSPAAAIELDRRPVKRVGDPAPI